MTDPYYVDDLVTLYHGDCREITEWLAADVLITDPPYGVRYDPGGPRRGYADRPLGDRIVSDNDTSIRDRILASWGESEKPAAVFGTWHAPRPKNTRQILVWWKRESKNLSRHRGRPWVSNWEEIYILGDWPKGEEDAAHGVIPTDEHRAAGYGAAATIGHPTPKPIVLMEQLLGKAPAGLIADPFAGSGSTLVAAKGLGRHAVGVELEERYCEISARRLAQDTLFGGAA
jgi:DNA modification methylase